MVSMEYYILLATVMFFLGLFGALFRRNLIMVMMSIELMLNAVNLIFIAASRTLGLLDGEVMVLFVITVAACEAAIGLAMVIALFRRSGSVNTDLLRLLRG
jgi:NADH-quinone oxidoreductase subunit K